jgi:hypothetical protein
MVAPGNYGGRADLYSLLRTLLDLYGLPAMGNAVTAPQMPHVWTNPPPSAAALPMPLVSHGDVWRYRKGVSAPQANWKTAADAGLDLTWLSGRGGIGYADNPYETVLCQTLVPDMLNAYTTVALRRAFEVTGTMETNRHLTLTMDYDDGFIAWLDGNYLASANMSGAPAEPAFNATALVKHESSRGDANALPATVYDLGPVGTRLEVGACVGRRRSEPELGQFRLHSCRRFGP